MTGLRGIFRNLIRSQDGAAAVEAAFILPVLLLVLLGSIEFGRLAWTQAGLNFAVQEAARCASVRPDLCDDPAQTAAFAAQRAAAHNVPATAFTVTIEPCGAQVRAQYAYRFAAYAIFASPTILTAQVCRP